MKHETAIRNIRRYQSYQHGKMHRNRNWQQNKIVQNTETRYTLKIVNTINLSKNDIKELQIFDNSTLCVEVVVSIMKDRLISERLNYLKII